MRPRSRFTARDGKDRRRGVVLASVVALLLLPAGAAPAGKPCIKLPALVERAIKPHAKRIKGAEFCEYRDLARGDVDRDGSEDVVVAYNIEGACSRRPGSPGSCGNDHVTFLTVFLKRGTRFTQVRPIAVGGRGEKSIAALRIADGHVEAETLEYAESDPVCCPSRKGRTTFLLEAKQLKEAGR